MKVYVKNYYLLCEPYELQTPTANGLFVGIENSKNIAKIIDIGKDITWGNECNLENGDIILYNENETKECIVCGKKYVIVHPSDVYATIKEEDE